MSCYNASRYLREAMESVLGQTYRDYEFLVVNDGSTDNTLAILKEYASRDARIRIIDKENTGLADSLNVGMAAAKGQWIARLDGDDVALPRRLERQVAFLMAHPDCHLVGSGLFMIDDNGTTIKRHAYPNKHDRLLSDLQRLRPFFGHSTAMFATDAARQVGGYNPYFKRAQDRDLWLRLAEGGAIACLREPLVKIRRHTEQISHHDNGRMQVVYGIAGQVCHFLRMRGAIDPSSQAQADWRQFMEWVTVRVEEQGLFRRREERQRLRQCYSNSPNRVVGVWHLLRGLASSKDVFATIGQKHFGSNMASRLADEWICCPSRSTNRPVPQRPLC
jgi:glycosyltransferase involved in cell wall biosynthesis